MAKATATKKKAKLTRTTARKAKKLPKRTAAKKGSKKTKKKLLKKTVKKTASKILKAKKGALKKPRTIVKVTIKNKKEVATTKPALQLVPQPAVIAGMPAPNFTLNDQNGSPVTLEQFKGRPVVLYFYPKDDTPGCTTESCSFRDNRPQFDTKNAVILGVSLDDEASHQKFIEKFNLNFTLLCDKDAAVSKTYGVYVQKNMYGNLSWGIERSTFIIDKDGKIVATFRKVKVDGHTEEVLAIVNNLN